jgi:hypothetical protein
MEIVILKALVIICLNVSAMTKKVTEAARLFFTNEVLISLKKGDGFVRDNLGLRLLLLLLYD